MGEINRRDSMKLAGVGGIVFASGLGFRAVAAASDQENDDVFFVQLSGPAGPH